MKQSGKSPVEVFVIMAIAAIFAALVFGSKGCPVGCNDSYSEGERVGIVTKISIRGWRYKTWEGEMNLGGLTSNANGQIETNVWRFTVPEEDEASLKLLQEAQRSQKPVIVKYKEWMIRPGCQTDSGYIVQGVEYVKTDSKESK